MFAGHYFGYHFYPAHFPVIPRRPMTFFGEPIWSGELKQACSESIAFVAEKREIEKLTECVHELEYKLDDSDDLLSFAGRANNKLLNVKQISDSEKISAQKCGLNIEVVNIPGFPIRKVNKFTEMEKEFLRSNGEIRDGRDFMSQFPEEPIPQDVRHMSTVVLHKMDNRLLSNSSSSLITLEHKDDTFQRPPKLVKMIKHIANFDKNTTVTEASTTELFSSDWSSNNMSYDSYPDELPSNNSLFSIGSHDDNHNMKPYLNQIDRVEKSNCTTNAKLMDALKYVKDITRLTSDIMQFVRGTNTSKTALDDLKIRVSGLPVEKSTPDRHGHKSMPMLGGRVETGRSVSRIPVRIATLREQKLKGNITKKLDITLTKCNLEKLTEKDENNNINGSSAIFPAL